jgi:hypothetical protein
VLERSGAVEIRTLGALFRVRRFHKTLAPSQDHQPRLPRDCTHKLERSYYIISSTKKFEMVFAKCATDRTMSCPTTTDKWIDRKSRSYRRSIHHDATQRTSYLSIRRTAHQKVSLGLTIIEAMRRDRAAISLCPSKSGAFCAAHLRSYHSNGSAHRDRVERLICSGTQEKQTKLALARFTER